jgi:hypothetical protein
MGVYVHQKTLQTFFKKSLLFTYKKQNFTKVFCWEVYVKNVMGALIFETRCQGMVENAEDDG